MGSRCSEKQHLPLLIHFSRDLAISQEIVWYDEPNDKCCDKSYHGLSRGGEWFIFVEYVIVLRELFSSK